MHVMCWRVGSPRAETGPTVEQATPALELIIVYLSHFHFSVSYCHAQHQQGGKSTDGGMEGWVGVGGGGRKGSFGVCVCGEDREKRSSRQQGRPVGGRGWSLRRDREDWEMSTRKTTGSRAADTSSGGPGRWLRHRQPGRNPPDIAN